MTQLDAGADARVYSDLGHAIRSVAPARSLPGVTGDPARIAAGIAVYRNNVRAAYLRVLRDTFPVVERLVGEAFLRYLAHEYFHAHPPRSPLVARYGDEFPGFIETFDPAAHLPYLADVARLELAWLAAYHATEAHALSPEEILSAVGDAPEDARFRLHPSVRLFSSRYPVHTIWQHNRAQRTERPHLASGGERIVVVRPAHKVVTLRISDGVWAALNEMARGAPLADAIEEAARLDPVTTPAAIVRTIAESRVVAAVEKPAPGRENP